MRGIALPVEDRLPGSGHHAGREAEFDEGPDAPCKQRVVELVDPAEVVGWAAVDLARRAQDVVEDVVEANVPEVEFVDGGLQLRQVLRTAGGAGIVGPDRQVEETVHRRLGARQVQRHVPRHPPSRVGRHGMDAKRQP